MPDSRFHTPVLLLIFNRPDTTQEMFDVIRRVKPETLYIAADGARPDKPGETEKCRQVRDIVGNIDWECRVERLFRDKNLGCKMAVSSAITWFFSRVDQGIILEDDCVPDESFFMFCQKLLEHYKNDNRVMHIGGTSVLDNVRDIIGDDSYYFSKIPEIWGWATWRRAWEKYNVVFPGYDDFIDKKYISTVFSNRHHAAHWMNWLDLVHVRGLDTWDFQWFYTIWTHNGLCVLPAINMVSNIGFREDATHTVNNESRIANIPSHAMEVEEMTHPHFILVNTALENMIMKRRFGVDHRTWYNYFSRLREVCKRFFIYIRNKTRLKILKIIAGKYKKLAAKY